MFGTKAGIRVENGRLIFGPDVLTVVPDYQQVEIFDVFIREHCQQPQSSEQEARW